MSCPSHSVVIPRRGRKLKNLVLVCPNHHAAIHQADAPFEFADLASHFKIGNLHRLEQLLLNNHLTLAA